MPALDPYGISTVPKIKPIDFSVNFSRPFIPKNLLEGNLPNTSDINRLSTPLLKRNAFGNAIVDTSVPKITPIDFSSIDLRQPITPVPVTPVKRDAFGNVVIDTSIPTPFNIEDIINKGYRAGNKNSFPERSDNIAFARRPAPTTSRNTITEAADDTYKQLLSQYGGQAGVSQLAGQTSLPTGFTPEGGKQAASLKDYYAAQQAVGSKNIGDIISSMGYTGPMAEWAKANPMLAQREFAKQRASGGRTSEDVTDQAMKEAAAKGQYFAPPGGPTPDPVTQQRMQQYSTAFQAQKGTEEQSASQRTQDFINKMKINVLNPGSYNFPSYDASAMMNAPSPFFK